MTNLREGEVETAVEMAEAVRSGDVDPRELVERAIARAEAWQPVTNAFSQLWGQEAMETASEAPSRNQPFPSVPLAVKDLFDVAGRVTSGCCEAFSGSVAARDADVIARALATGMALVGKTNQQELAAGGTNLVSACGRTHNPWDPQRITGGSSGGSGAAVAAGVVPWAFGSDTGGSIRIPASMCGTFGLKPTTGQLSLDGLMPLGPDLDCPGPVAATLPDLVALYEVMLGSPDPLASTASLLDQAAASGLGVGVPDGFFADRIHVETARAVGSVARDLEEEGARVETVDGKGIENARRVWNTVCFSGFARAYPQLGELRQLVHPEVMSWWDEGRAVSAEQLSDAARRRSEIRTWFLDRLEPVDTLLIPTTPYPAFSPDADEVDLGDGTSVGWRDVGPGWLSCSVNLAGLPALSLPAATSTEGLPIGVSLIGRPNEESKLFRLARLWETGSSFRPTRPPIPTG